MITLYTPATGFPDLEIKIAYGLARVGIEAGIEFKLLVDKGFYKIEFETDSDDKLKQSFLNILRRLLSSDRFFDLGVKAKDKGKYSANNEIIENINKKCEFLKVFNFRDFSNLDIKKDIFCGHPYIPKFGRSSGLILISSFHAGKPYERDKRFSTFNQSLCSICGYLAVLGLHSFAFNIQMGSRENKKYCLVLPIPQDRLITEQLLLLLSFQKTLHNFWLSDILPLETFVIGLLSKVPSLCDIIKDLHLLFHLSLLSKNNRGDTVIEQTAFVNTLKFAKFISDNPFNAACIEKLLGNSKTQPKISSLLEITNILKSQQKFNILKFARLYAKETSTDNFSNLLYPETTKYLLKEVAMIKQNIIENPSLKSLARTLRYFIREKKYSYADNIRNAKKETKDFEETIVKMLREGRLRLEQKEMIHLPSDEEIKKVFELANEDFESTKLALVMLAFTFPSENDEIAEKKENEQNK